MKEIPSKGYTESIFYTPVLEEICISQTFIGRNPSCVLVSQLPYVLVIQPPFYVMQSRVLGKVIRKAYPLDSDRFGGYVNYPAIEQLGPGL